MSQDSFYIDLNKWITFDKAYGDNIVTDDTVRLIVKTINNFWNTAYIKKVCDILSVGNPDAFEFCRRLFGVCCVNVKYQRDPVGHEIVFTPQLLMKVGKGDCKKFTTFICAVLKYKGIPCATKVVSYDGYDWEHIYAIVPMSNGQYITLDPVNECKFNSEVDFKKARINYLDGTYSKIMTKLSLMGNIPQAMTNESYAGYLSLQGINNSAVGVLEDLEALTGVGEGASQYDEDILSGLEDDFIGGINDDEESTINGIEAKSPTRQAKQAAKTEKKAVRKAEVKQKREVKKAAAPANKQARIEKRKKVFNVAKKAGFGPIRVAFLGLIKLAGALEHTPLKFNLAANLAKAWQMDGGKEITAMWEKFGGKRDALKVALSKAAKVQLAGVGDASSLLTLSGIGSAAAAASLIAASTPILIASLKYLKDKKIINAGQANSLDQTLNLVEDVTTLPDGTLSDKALALLQKQPILEEAIKIDDGGNKATQQEIKAEVIKEAPETPSFIPPPPASTDSQAKTTPPPPTPTDTTNNNPNNLPAPADMLPQPKSMAGNIRYPHVWLRMCFVLMCITNIVAISKPLVNIISTALFAGIIITTIYLFTSKKNNNGKI